jgi:hypothetical protein
MILGVDHRVVHPEFAALADELWVCFSSCAWSGAASGTERAQRPVAAAIETQGRRPGGGQSAPGRGGVDLDQRRRRHGYRSDPRGCVVADPAAVDQAVVGAVISLVGTLAVG